MANHHKAYVDNLNKLVEGKDLAQMSLEDIIRKSAGDAALVGVFNNAAQIWNHTFYWNSLKPNGGGKPTGAITAAIDKDLGGYDKFKADFANAAVTQFGVRVGLAGFGCGRSEDREDWQR